MCVQINVKVLIIFSIHQNSVQGAIPTNLPNTAVGLRPPYSPGLSTSSTQLTTQYFNSAVSSLPPLESSSLLGQSEASSQTMDSLGSFSSGDAAGKGGSGSLITGGLDSLSEYTLPGECFNLKCDTHLGLGDVSKNLYISIFRLICGILYISLYFLHFCISIKQIN